MPIFAMAIGIDLGDVQLAFDTEVLWNLDNISPEFACWITQQVHVPATSSRLGILSTGKFERLLEGLDHEDLRRAFKLLYESSSLLSRFQDQPHVSWKGYCTIDLGNMRSFAGTMVLQSLEKALNNAALATASLGELRALFLVILGTIITSSYSKPSAHTHSVSHNMTLLTTILMAAKTTEMISISTRCYDDAQQQLLHILAHHMIQVAERASMLDEKSDKNSLIERANRLWDTQAFSEWRRKFSPPKGSQSSAHFGARSIDQSMNPCVQGSPAGKGITEANGLRHALLCCCKKCGMVMDTSGLCPSCASLVDDGMAPMEPTSSPESNLRTKSTIAPEPPIWVADKWTSEIYQSQGTIAASIVHSRCSSCGATTLSGEGTCFACFFSYSNLADYTNSNFLYQAPFPVAEGMFSKGNTSTSTLPDEDFASSQLLSTASGCDWGLDPVFASIPAGFAENTVVGRDYHSTRGIQTGHSNAYHGLHKCHCSTCEQIGTSAGLPTVRIV